MDWKNRRYFLVKDINSFDKERLIFNLKQKAKITLHTRPEVKQKTYNNVIRQNHNIIYKDEHIPRGFYNYMIGCFEEQAHIVLDYLEKNNLNFKELKQYKNNKMINKKSWEEFRENGLLLFINQILHVFGWAICFDFDKNTGDLKEVYPARVRFRGFSNQSVSEAYTNLSKFIKNNAEDLYIESRE